MTTQTYSLSKEEVHDYIDRGYSGPHTLCTSEEMAVIREKILAEVLTTPPPFDEENSQSRYLDCRVVYDLCAHPAIVNRVKCIFGDDIMLWKSNFFRKDPGGKEVPWHQDTNYWPIEPSLNISAWIAIDDATIENSCVQIIPGSHTKIITHLAATGKEFQSEADPRHVETEKAIAMELKAGQFFLFTEKMLHYSAVNTSTKRRLGLAVGMSVPFVKTYHHKLFRGHKCIMISGKDSIGINEFTSPPTS